MKIKKPWIYGQDKRRFRLDYYNNYDIMPLTFINPFYLYIIRRGFTDISVVSFIS